MVAKIKGQNFEQEVLDSDLPVLVFFISAKCNTCFALSLVISELAEQYDDKVMFVKVSIEDNLEAADMYGIKSLPTILLFKKSTLIQKSVGFHYKSSLRGWLEESI